jgi:hypothetical protein
MARRMNPKPWASRCPEVTGGMMRGFARWLAISGAGAVALAVSTAGIVPASAAPSAISRPTVSARPNARDLPTVGGRAVAASAVAVSAVTARADQAGSVSPTPAAGTPALVHTGSSSSFQNVGQIVQCGDTMYAVGDFSEVTWNGTTYDRSNIFSFSASAPYTVSSWNPSVNGVIESITLTSNCNHAYIGGKFSEVEGSAAAHIAEIRTYNTAPVKDFASDASSTVDTVLLAGSHLLVGGVFNKINGSKNPYYVSLNPSTGLDDGYLKLDISGHYSYPKAAAIGTGVYNQQLSPASYGSYVLAEGVFTKVQGFARQQIFMMRLASTRGQVTTWTSSNFLQFCTHKVPFYVHDAAWAPDGSAIYVGDTGLAPWNWNGSFPLTGICDAAAAFPSNRASVSPEWINYTGCDSFYSIAADGSAVYAAGHPRWSENANACNAEGPGAIPDRGLQGLSPSTGDTLLNSSGTALYTMARANATDMIVTSAGLWIASSNRYGSDSCGGVGGHAGICFLPYS